MRRGPARLVAWDADLGVGGDPQAEVELGVEVDPTAEGADVTLTTPEGFLTDPGT